MAHVLQSSTSILTALLSCRGTFLFILYILDYAMHAFVDLPVLLQIMFALF